MNFQRAGVESGGNNERGQAAEGSSINVVGAQDYLQRLYTICSNDNR